MKAFYASVVGCFMTLVLSGCVRNTLVIVAPQVRPFTPAVSCLSPEDKDLHYLMAWEPFPALFSPSEIAKAQHVSGCAAIVFQLNRDGKARNIALLRERPPGYGYGAIIAEQTRRATFVPPASEKDWYYRAESYTFAGRPFAPAPAVPVAPGRAPSAFR